MPHLVIEYAAPLEQRIDINDLVAVTHGVFMAQPTVTAKDVKTRALPAAAYKAGSDAGLFLHAEVRLLEGRSWQELTTIQQALVSAFKQKVPADVIFTLEIREMKKAFYSKS